MTHLQVESSFIDDLAKNTFMRQKCNEFTEAVEQGRDFTSKFLEDNPDFLQMMMHMAQDERIKVVDEPTPAQPYDCMELSQDMKDYGFVYRPPNFPENIPLPIALTDVFILDMTKKPDQHYENHAH